MSPTVSGAVIGAVLALTWLLVGFWAFLFVALFMVIGALVARIMSGQLDVRALVGAFSGRRTSL